MHSSEIHAIISSCSRLISADGLPVRHSASKKITFWKEAFDELLVKVFIESQAKAPAEIILDVDTTDLPLHGKQEGRFFHGYYEGYCYLPLYIFCGDHIDGKENPRFVVTSLTSEKWAAQALYERQYCGRSCAASDCVPAQR